MKAFKSEPKEAEKSSFSGCFDPWKAIVMHA
jgi:hypothetical protein